MNDDLSTITNTYPDHEDLQGPAGINIPQVMTNFIPKNSILITSEEIMYPILKTYANRVDTKTYQVGWLEAGLISSDILDRFPYEEHPFNIALVLRMAKELGLNEDNSLKAMADNIVPDLGVLKVYPPAKINARTLQFTNGMSANERFGALGNWKRMGFDIIDDEKEPNIFITVVINNRADRVSRSRVFASMLIEDVVADKYLLIGSNLSGFLNYLEESWENYKNKLSFDTNDKIIDLIAKFRIIRSSEQLISKLKIMLESCGISEELQKEIIENYNDLKKLEILLKDYSEIFKFYTLQKKEYDEFLDLKKIIDENSDIEKVTEFFQNQMWLWFKNRIVVVENYHAKGDEIVQIICDNTPIGMKNRVIGMQNIKGTGLDFAYRWVAWDKCYKICQDIKNGDGDIVKKALEQLAAFKEFGPLSFELAQESIDIGKKSVSTQSDYYQAQIQLIQTNLSSAKNRFLLLNNDNNDKIERSKWWYKILDIIEAFLDAGDAVKRRKKSNFSSCASIRKISGGISCMAGASKTILVMSDSHGDRQIVEEIKNRYFGKVDAIFHNGDSELDSQDSIWDGVYVVNGNCDYFGGYPDQLVTNLDDVTIAQTHGHLYGINYGWQRLDYWAQEVDADICLYGHLHVPDAEVRGKTLFLNPGSVSQPRGLVKE